MIKIYTIKDRVLSMQVAEAKVIMFTLLKDNRAKVQPVSHTKIALKLVLLD